MSSNNENKDTSTESVKSLEASVSEPASTYLQNTDVKGSGDESGTSIHEIDSSTELVASSLSTAAHKKSDADEEIPGQNARKIAALSTVLNASVQSTESTQTLFTSEVEKSSLSLTNTMPNKDSLSVSAASDVEQVKLVSNFSQRNQNPLDDEASARSVSRQNLNLVGASDVSVSLSSVDISKAKNPDDGNSVNNLLIPLPPLSTHDHNVSDIINDSDSSALSVVSSNSGDYKSAVSSFSPPHSAIIYRNASTVCDYLELPAKRSVGTQIEENFDEVNSSRTTVCPKHKTAVIAEEITPTTITETPNLCLSCSKSMLSYITIIHKFLEGLATDICKQIDPLTQCYECVKEKLNIPHETYHTCNKSVTDSLETSIQKHQITGKSRKKSDTSKTREDSSVVSSRTSTPYKSSVDRRSGLLKRFETPAQQLEVQNITPSSNIQQNHTRESEDAGNKPQKDENIQYHISESESPKYTEAKSNKHQRNTGHQEPASLDINQTAPSSQKEQKTDTSSKIQQFANVQQYQNYSTGNHQQQQYFSTQISETQTANDLRTQQLYSEAASSDSVPVQATPIDHGLEDMLSDSSFQGSPSPQFLHGDGIDGILSTLYKVECGLRDMSRGPNVWERIAELQQQSEPFEREKNEAFVTIARNNAEVLGCLVLGASLLLCGTVKTLCVLVSDTVNSDFLAPLSSVFHVVMHVRSLDSVGTTKLALLDQPDLGISFGKLNVWRLQQFTKCVFLNPDTVVVQNSDELFCHEEFSAVPDIGWPDCFNSGVFVFKPSDQTFWELLEFAENHGSYDGGEQGLLNCYFSSWSHDIHKKLSFIYNLMANVSYTYTPAFKQFGRNVKIVQFLGPFKPWHVKYFSDSGQIAHSSAVHPTYVQFVYVWINVFRVSVLPLFSQEIQLFVSSQNTLSAYELLRFFPSPIESEVEFLLTPPSVRIRPSVGSAAQTAMPFPTVIEKLQLPATSALVIESSKESESELIPREEQDNQRYNVSSEEARSKELISSESKLVDEKADDVEELADSSENNEKAVKPKSLIPGAEVGDFQGMSAWEQGRMDYEGAASSDTIIERLRYLMGKPERLV